eukprot:05014_6
MILGTSSFTLRSRLGRTSSRSTVWTAFTSLTCHVGQAFRGSRRINLTAGVIIGSLTRIFSIDGIMLSSMKMLNWGSSGSDLLTMLGASMGLGYTGRARIGRTVCQQTQWASQTAVFSMAGHGVAKSMRAVLTVAEGSGTLTQTFSVDAAGLSHLTRMNHVSSGSVISLIGTGFSQGRASVRVRVHITSCQQTRWLS